jgi:dihydrofolate reductase
MSLVSLVVAVSRNGVIGRDGGLPWRISSDLKLFKAITMGKPIIMGRKTWDSLPRKPLPGRRNIVVTTAAGFVAEGAETAASPAAALASAGRDGAPEVCVIGGGTIYKALLPKAGRIYLSEVDMVADGDTHFPMPDPEHWREVSSEAHPAAPGDTAGFTLRVLDRI